ncbi:MAG: 30S ribosome-binding factor RbfA [Planctomycetota bacterium]
MASQRSADRIASWIQKKVATMMIRDLKDPRSGFLTVTRVVVSKDIENCTIYYSVLGDDKERRNAARMLERATPFVQREVASGLKTRVAPKVLFKFDETIDKSLELDQIFSRIAKERKDRESL